MAVYTHVTAEDIAAFMAGYDAGDVVSFKGIAEGVENSNYLLKTTKETYILTLYEKRVNPDDLPFFLGLMDHLAHKGINCATPIRDRTGEILKELCGRPAALISFLDGLSIDGPVGDHCYQLGGAQAEMHLAAADFKLARKNDLSLQGWKDLAKQCEERADDCIAGLGQILHDEIDYLEQNWSENLPNGIIHGDLFPDNVFFLGDKLSGVIDFYFACSDMMAFDVAVSLNAWCFQADGSFNAAYAKELIRGYHEVRPLSAEEVRALPMLCRGAALRFLLTRLYDWLNRVEGALVATKDPGEYLAKLKFHQQADSAALYGVDS